MKQMLNLIKTIRKITYPYGSNHHRAIEFEEMDRVSMSESYESGGFNPHFSIEFKDESTIRVFAEMLRSTVELVEDDRTVFPDFDLELSWRGGMIERYHLRLGYHGQPSTLQHCDYAHLRFSVPSHVTNRLIDLLGIDH